MATTSNADGSTLSLGFCELPVQYYNRADYIEMGTGNKVCRQSSIYGSQNIVLGGKTIIQNDVVVRGDLRRVGAGHAVAISIGKFCNLCPGVVVRPPYKTYKGIFTYYPTKIGDHVIIEENSIVEAASIGSFVHIGKNCVIGRFVMIKDCVRILDGAVIPPNTIVPPFSVYGGNLATLVGEWPESSQELMETATTRFFHCGFLPKAAATTQAS
ncbi:dynactin subunit P25 [Entophlyctis helioformis]|nr:dynactin subunit P25 [Entophlyctis helioformis]